MIPTLRSRPVRLPTVLLALLLFFPPAVAAQPANYEVWIIDQGDAALGGSKLYVYSAASVGGAQPTGQPEVVDLEAGAQGIGDGAGVRPHLLAFNSTHSHGVLAYVASGHVQVIRAADRKVVASIDVGDQAHGAAPSPDDKLLLVANQNGKRLAVIRSDFAREQFTYDPAEDLDLKALEDDEHPDNAPICPLVFSDSRKAYVSMRGGGLYVVDLSTSPMQVVRQYGKSQVAAAGCGGALHGAKMYVNSGTATSGNLYVFDTTTDSLLRSIEMTPRGTDSHVMILVGGNRYLWMNNRGDGDNVVVVDTASDEVVGTFPIVAAPDMMDSSPAGDRVFVSQRGPNALTGGPSARGETPGLGVLGIRDGGRTGAQLFFVPIGDQSAQSAVDPHGLAVRRLSAPAPAATPPPAPAPASAAPAPAPPAQPAPPAATAPPAQVPRALPRTGEPLSALATGGLAGTALLLLGAALHRRRQH
jgi:DNA-binding beta-propeller fold protein YncE